MSVITIQTGQTNARNFITAVLVVMNPGDTLIIADSNIILEPNDIFFNCNSVTSNREGDWIAQGGQILGINIPIDAFVRVGKCTITPRF
jgi:hypothetical protein